MAQTEAVMLTGGVRFNPIFGLWGPSGTLNRRGGLETVANNAVKLLVCDEGDCAHLLRYQQSSCASASNGVAFCTKGTSPIGIRS